MGKDNECSPFFRFGQFKMQSSGGSRATGMGRPLASRQGTFGILRPPTVSLADLRLGSGLTSVLKRRRISSRSRSNSSIIARLSTFAPVNEPQV